MRDSTKKRLLAMLEADEKRLTAKIETDPFAEWDKLSQETQALAQKSVALLYRGGPEWSATVLELRAAEKKQSEAWDKGNRDSKKLEKWYTERRTVRQEIDTLKRLLY